MSDQGEEKVSVGVPRLDLGLPPENAVTALRYLVEDIAKLYVGHVSNPTMRSRIAWEEAYDKAWPLIQTSIMAMVDHEICKLLDLRSEKIEPPT